MFVQKDLYTVDVPVFILFLFKIPSSLHQDVHNDLYEFLVKICILMISLYQDSQFTLNPKVHFDRFLPH